MAFSPRVLRVVLASVAAVLVAVVLGFIGYAHYRAQNFLLGLPKRLGMDIRQETDNVTYSQSFGGKTVFTVHAAKQIQHQDGKFTLKDVGIILYGREADRADKIHGAEFEYDQKNGVLTAVGDVFIDLAAPAGKNPAAKTSEDDRVVHVKTSGLIYLQKERTATTQHEIDFSAGSMTGTAVGASYAGGTGVVILDSAVHVSGIRDGKPVLLTASRAELDREGNLAKLETMRYSTTGEHGTESLAAGHAVVRMQKDGTPQHVDAEGHVILAADGKGTLTGRRLEADFSGNGLMKLGHLLGDVHFVEQARGTESSGAADDLRVAFDLQGKPLHAQLQGSVAMEQKSAAAIRTLNGDRVALALSGGGKQRLMVRTAEATAAQGAVLRVQEATVKGRSDTTVRADKLVGRFGAANALTGLDGHGRTELTRLASTPAGATLSKDVSNGEELRLDLRAAEKGRTELVRAEQRGAVTAIRTVAAKKPGEASTVEHARAADAVYNADEDNVLLTGAVQISDAGSLLQADRVAMDRTTGVATATGAVKVSYIQEGSAGEPVHVLGTEAVAHKDTSVTEFTAGGGLVRMWQAGSQVEAPVIDFDQKTKTVLARGLAAGVVAGQGAGQVRAVLVGADKSGAPIRVTGSQMRYTDASRTVELKGPVRVDDGDGRMSANQAVLTLSPAASGAAKPAPGFLGGGRVERMVSTGAVEVVQPGRKATGDKLVYTAADGVFLLTGSKTAPPRVIDATRGTITGASLRFTSGEDSVVVLGGEGGRVRTDTRVKQ